MSSSLARVARALGQLDDPTADDFNAGDGLDGKQAYAAWQRTVKQYGGATVEYPVDDGTYSVSASPLWTFGGLFSTDVSRKGLPAARYPFGVIYDANLNLAPIFHRNPDVFSSDKRYGYYLAPPAVLDWYLTGGQQELQTFNTATDPTPPMPDWYTKAITIAKVGGLIVGGLVVVNVLSYLPRPRANPPHATRRRRRSARRR